ncbi:efflux RND transporter periplasmic adaptor subunit [Magnetovibrio sp.]|uniref:efflux RND transporter periplasmic adaptor subunit n=1 Tax=Magnetovibrio sp. TaxID=2024836 RepID=UPI002F91E59F
MNTPRPKTESVDSRLLHLSAALLVEREVRAYRDPKTLAHYLVNETARLHQHSLAFLIRPKAGGWAVLAATDVSAVESNSVLGDWLRDVADNRTGDTIETFQTAALNPPEEIAGGLPAHAMWMALKHPDGGLAGVLLVMRASAFENKDCLIAEPMAECYGHALVALDDRPWLRRFRGVNRRRWLIGGAIGLLLVGVWPVPMTALAPVEVVAKKPTPITAPFDGIVSEVEVEPYQNVKAEQVLVRMDQTELAMRYNVAKRSLAVTIAELERFRHEAYQNLESKAKLAIWELKVELRRQELDNAKEKLNRHRITAPSGGVVLYDHRFNWRGQPVKAGQRMMTVAQPDRLEAQIDLSAAALIPLTTGDDATLFLDMDPTHPIAAQLTSIGYQAQPTAAGNLAYRYRADFVDALNGDFLGARGTARLEGSNIPLAYAVLRRPIAALRQFVGL